MALGFYAQEAEGAFGEAFLQDHNNQCVLRIYATNRRFLAGR